MRYRLLTSVGVVTAMIAVVLPVAVAGQTTALTTTAAESWVSPRTPWGDPDLQGIWTNVNEAATPFERPDEYAGRQVLGDDELAEIVREQHQRAADPETRAQRIAGYERGSNFPIHWAEHLDAPENSQRPWLVVDPPNGKVPALIPEAQKRAAARAQDRRDPNAPDGPEDLGPWPRCITRGLPGIMMPTWYNNTYQIVQAPGYVVILYEMMHDARIIPLDGRPHVPQHIRQWLGDSRGRWEGDTLVVDATNFTDKTSYRGSTENLQLVERFTRVDADTINWEVTVDDPTTWVQPWKFAIPLTDARGDRLVYEYACHEGNRSMENILKGARVREKAAEEAANQR